MKRIKVSENFYLDEFIHPNIYNQWGERSKRYLNPKLVDLVQSLRNVFGSITINNWATGGNFINSGLRDFKDPLGGKLNRSGHYYGNCADLKFGSTTIKTVHELIMSNQELYKAYFHMFLMAPAYSDMPLAIVERFNGNVELVVADCIKFNDTDLSPENF